MNGGQPTPESVIAAAKTSKKISRYAQGALLLFAIASVIAGWSGNKLSTIILTVVVVFGFMIALLGFQRLATAKDGYYSKLAIALTSVVLVLIVALFGTVLIYLGTGYPPWLDRFFGYETAPAPSASIDAGSVSSTRIVLDLKPYLNPQAKIEVSVFENGGEQVVREPEGISAQITRYVLEGLKPASQYRIRLVAIARYRQSLPTDLTRATNADRMPFAVLDHPGAVAHYSGPLTEKLIPESENGTVSFDDSGGAWAYEGPVHNGLLDGTGRMSFVPNEAEPACNDAALAILQVCNSTCSDVKFGGGQFKSATCELVLGNAVWRQKDQQFGIDTAGAYSGGISPGALDSQIRLGPYRIAFEGSGVLASGKTTIDGNWHNGALEGNGRMSLNTGEMRIGGFEQGNLKNGQVFGQPFSLAEPNGSVPSDTLSYDVAQFGPNGTAVRLASDGFAFGTIRNSDPRGPFIPGYEGKITDSGFTLKRFDEAHPAGRETHPTTDPKNRDCYYHETFGLDVSATDWSSKGWQLNTINHLPDSTDSPGDPPDNEVTLDISPADIHVRSFRSRGAAADVRFWLGSNFQTEQALDIGGSAITTNTINSAKQAQGALTFARLCSAKKVTNLTNGISADVTELCPIIAILFARTYYCDPSPDQSLPSAWRPEEKVGNWLVTLMKAGSNRENLTVTSADAELTTSSKEYEYTIRYSCANDGTNIFGLGLWGPDLTGDKPHTTRDFTFSANGHESTFTLASPRNGVYEIAPADRQPIADLLRSAQLVTVSFTSFLGTTVAFDFSPDGAEKALGTVLPNCSNH
ncbi:fibronectin type III domain-containing protein [Mesorhizobium sp. B2-3-5]|uniref:fibronectin type III domain-containing protein n=1 Tax=Mesorhizobium sp. B2-3-5 TaxID=2589958 RepID=UPI00112DE9CA|nr:fibronectin type III domain-containing protein [Mesorhizobium sp. B2-3-5]TPM13492.1 fibronectin type III domain-containing protein [Mesorhizobium sp. B2-3-5]